MERINIYVDSIIFFFKASKSADFTMEYIIHHIILLLKSGKNADFTTEHIIQCIVMFLNVSKNADFMAEHSMQCDLKPVKCRFYDGVHYTLQRNVSYIESQQKCRFYDGVYYTSHLRIILLLKCSKNADFTTEHIICDLKQLKITISRRSIIYIAMYRY